MMDKTFNFTTLAVMALFWNGFDSGQAKAKEIGSGMHPYPLWPSIPVPGWPGVEVDEATTYEKLKGPGGGTATYGQPEFLAYPGAVHHIRHVYQRRISPYPLYNHKTLVKNFVMSKLPEYKGKCVEFAEPVYYTPNLGPRMGTSKRRQETKVYPWKPGSDPIKLELGNLPRGIYVIRPIVAAPKVTKVEPPTLVRFGLRINDDRSKKTTPRGYTLHSSVLDNFYAVQEFMFRSWGDGRRFSAEIKLLQDSKTDLVLHNVDLHDHLASLPKKRIKKKTSFGDILPAELSKRKELWEKNRKANPKAWEALKSKQRNASEQKKVDDLIWQCSMPPLNTHLVGAGYYLQRAKTLPLRFMRLGDGWQRYAQEAAKGMEEANALGISNLRSFLHHAPEGILFVEAKKPWGQVYTEKPDGKDVDSVKVEPGWQIDAGAMGMLFAAGSSTVSNMGLNKRAKGSLQPWVTFGNRQTIRDEAIRFIRYVWQAPLINGKHSLAYVAGFEGLNRGVIFHRDMKPDMDDLYCYDLLFDFLANDQELATAIGRYLPWIKSPDDVIELVDTYLVQDFANKIMHYRQYTDMQVDDMLEVVQVANHHPEETRPWMEFIFTNSRQYPLIQGSVTDQFVTDYTRDGGIDRGSFSMGLGAPPGSRPVLPGRPSLAKSFDKHLQSGGSRKYDIGSREHNPARWELPYFLLEGTAAGRINPGIGAGGGPAEPYGKFTDTPSARKIIKLGWDLHQDPRFAWELANTFERAEENDEEWKKVVEASKQQRGDPYLANRSRVISQWSGYLEDGHQHQDFRFRRAVGVRLGGAFGYFTHRDTLDLRLFAFGMTMSGDFNQQQGYGLPPQRMTRLHNVVEVDGKNWRGHAWIRGLLDSRGNQYLSAEASPPHDMPEVRLFRRQVAMIETHPGKASAKGEPRRDSTVTLPSGYLVDVFRVSGGKSHAYNFHGCVDDGFEINVTDQDPPKQKHEVEYLQPYKPGTKPKDLEHAPAGGFPLKSDPDYWAGTVMQKDLVATWRLRRDAEEKMLAGQKHFGAVPTKERKFVRMHLLDQKGNRVLQGVARGKDGNGYYGRCIHSIRENNESVFTAIIEPYAGEPTVREIRNLEIPANHSDAKRAIAVEISTSRETRDIIFADGHPEETRRFSGLKISAEYAMVSKDDKGISKAAIFAGRMIYCEELTLEPHFTKYSSEIEWVDYPNRKLYLKGKLPQELAGQFFEVGNELHKTNIEIIDLNTVGDKTVATMRKSLELMRVRCHALNGNQGTARGSMAKIRFNGRDSGLTATNSQATKYWKVSYREDRGPKPESDNANGILFKLSNPEGKNEEPIFVNEDLPGGGLRIWDAGPGDILELKTAIAIRRISDKERIFEVTANCPFKLTTFAKIAEWSKDGKNWKKLNPSRKGKRIEVELGLEHRFVRLL